MVVIFHVFLHWVVYFALEDLRLRLPWDHKEASQTLSHVVFKRMCDQMLPICLFACADSHQGDPCCESSSVSFKPTWDWLAIRHCIYHICQLLPSYRSSSLLSLCLILWEAQCEVWELHSGDTRKIWHIVLQRDRHWMWLWVLVGLLFAALFHLTIWLFQKVRI